MFVDAHHHFWRLDRGDYGWLEPSKDAIYRDFGPADLAPLLSKYDIERTILVQAAPTVAETEFLLALATEAPFVAGVVGWIDLAAPDAVESIDRLAQNPLLVGIRPMIQDIADDDWLLEHRLAPGLQALVEQKLMLDALVLPRHLSRLLVLLDRHPDLGVVVDHAAKPRIRDGILDPWRADMTAIAARPNTTCKLSGLVTEAAMDWSIDHLRPYVAHLLQVFGPQRLIWGSDWPVVNLAGGYDAWRRATVALLGELSPVDLQDVLGENALRIYRRSYPNIGCL